MTKNIFLMLVLAVFTPQLCGMMGTVPVLKTYPVLVAAAYWYTGDVRETDAISTAGMLALYSAGQTYDCGYNAYCAACHIAKHGTSMESLTATGVSIDQKLKEIRAAQSDGKSTSRERSEVDKELRGALFLFWHKRAPSFCFRYLFKTIGWLGLTGISGYYLYSLL